VLAQGGDPLEPPLAQRPPLLRRVGRGRAGPGGRPPGTPADPAAALLAGARAAVDPSWLGFRGPGRQSQHAGWDPASWRWPVPPSKTAGFWLPAITSRCWPGGGPGVPG